MKFEHFSKSEKFVILSLPLASDSVTLTRCNRRLSKTDCAAEATWDWKLTSAAAESGAEGMSGVEGMSGAAVVLWWAKQKALGLVWALVLGLVLEQIAHNTCRRC